MFEDDEQKLNPDGINLDETELKEGQTLRALEIKNPSSDVQYTVHDSDIEPNDLVRFNYISDHNLNFINITTRNGDNFNVCADRFEKTCRFVDHFVQYRNMIG